MTQSTFVTQSIDHLGIVAGICHQIGLVETIDTFIGQTNRKVSVGQAVMAMILNALGFVGRPRFGLCRSSAVFDARIFFQ